MPESEDVGDSLAGKLRTWADELDATADALAGRSETFAPSPHARAGQMLAQGVRALAADVRKGALGAEWQEFLDSLE